MRHRASGGPRGIIRRTGYRLAATARDLRLLRELVVETDRARRARRAEHALQAGA